MQETDRAEIAAAYDAVLALMNMTDSGEFRFRVDVMGVAQWLRILSTSRGLDAGKRMGIESVELARCPVELAPGVLRRVLEIARTPAFHDRCLNADRRSITPDEIRRDQSDHEAVLYLTKYREGTKDVRAETEVHASCASHAVSGVRPRVDQSVPAQGDAASEALTPPGRARDGRSG